MPSPEGENVDCCSFWGWTLGALGIQPSLKLISKGSLGIVALLVTGSKLVLEETVMIREAQ